MPTPARWGLSVPLDGIPLHEQVAIYREAEALGFTDLWSLEVDGVDCFTPLALAAAVTERLRLGTAIANVFTRGPATLAMSAAGLAEAAPRRFCLGIGAASQPIVEGWNGDRFERPYARVRDTVTVLRSAFSGVRVSAALETMTIDGFRLSRPPSDPIPIFVAALRETMLRLAGRVADGVILNWLGPSDVPRSLAVVRAAAERAGRDPASIETAARIFVFVDPPGPETDAFRRRLVAGYLIVGVYRAFQEWLRRGEALAPMLERWDAGDRRGAVAAIPDPVLDALTVAGPPEQRRERIAAYVAAGIDVPIVHLVTAEADPQRRAAAMLRGFRESAPR